MAESETISDQMDRLSNLILKLHTSRERMLQASKSMLSRTSSNSVLGNDRHLNRQISFPSTWKTYYQIDDDITNFMERLENDCAQSNIPSCHLVRALMFTLNHEDFVDDKAWVRTELLDKNRPWAECKEMFELHMQPHRTRGFAQNVRRWTSLKQEPDQSVRIFKQQFLKLARAIGEDQDKLVNVYKFIFGLLPRYEEAVGKDDTLNLYNRDDVTFDEAFNSASRQEYLGLEFKAQAHSSKAKPHKSKNDRKTHQPNRRIKLTDDSFDECTYPSCRSKYSHPTDLCFRKRYDENKKINIESCMKCGQVGHLVKNCTTSKAKIGAKIGALITARVGAIMVETLPSEVDTITKPMEPTPAKLLQAFFGVNGKLVKALIDGGAQVSVISSHLATKLNLQSFDVKSFECKDFLDRSTDSPSYAVVNLTHGKKTIEASVIIMDIPQDLLIARDLFPVLGFGDSGVSHELPDEFITNLTVSSDPHLSNQEINDAWDGEDEIDLNERKSLLSNIDAAIQENLKLDPFELCNHPASVIPLDTSDDIPVFRRQYKVPDIYHPKVTAQIDDWFEKKIIIEATPSQYNSSLVAVRKKDQNGFYSDCRVCLDPRPLNEKLPNFRHAIPKAKELFRELSGATYFSALDLNSSYHQFSLKSEDRHKTSFTWNGKKYMFRGAPFGLKPMTQRFQSVMEQVLDSCREFVVIYIDDIVVKSNSLREHIDHVNRVLRCLTRYKLRINRKKCHFGFRCLRVLGHIISGTEIKVDPRKSRDVLQIPQPATGKDIMSFLGVVNYLRDYIPLYSQLAAPLERLRDVIDVSPFWKEKEQESFDAFITILQNPPILHFPVDGVPFVIATDASQCGVGSVLYQIVDDQIRYILFASASLNTAQRNYSATRRELLAIVFSLKSFHNYIWGTQFTLKTDHMALTYLFTQKHTNYMMNEWMDFLTNYTFSIVHCPGVLNVLPDALSRLYPKTVMVASHADFETILDSAKKKKKKKKKQPLTSTINEVKVTYPERKLAAFILERFDKIAPDESKREALVCAAHDDGHFGVEYVFVKLWDDGFFWPDMRQMIKEVCKSCTSCLQHNVGRNGFHPLVSVHAIVPGDHIAVDLAGPFPTSESGNNFIFIFVDVATKFVVLLPIPDKTMSTLSKTFFHLIALYGSPKIIQSDNGTEFVNRMVRGLLEVVGTSHRRIAAYNPRANAAAESMVKIAKRCLKKMEEIMADSSVWDNHLDALMISINSKFSNLTKCTPHSLFLARPVTPYQDFTASQDCLMTEQELESRIKMMMEVVYPDIADAVLNRRNNINSYADGRRRGRVTNDRLPIGARVMIRNKQRTKKSQPTFIGPFSVAQVLSSGSYRLLDASSRLLPRPVPRDQMKIISYPDPLEGAQVEEDAEEPEKNQLYEVKLAVGVTIAFVDTPQAADLILGTVMTCNNGVVKVHILNPSSKNIKTARFKPLYIDPRDNRACYKTSNEPFTAEIDLADSLIMLQDLNFDKRCCLTPDSLEVLTRACKADGWSIQKL
jgi:hypothetical protein